jgi:hypothetical protein
MIKLIMFICFFLTTNFAFALEPLPPFDWSKIINMPPVPSINEGNQVLHFKIKNKPYENDVNAVKFVKKYLTAAKKLRADSEVIRFGSDAVTLNGAFIEIGTIVGKNSNFIAALNPFKKIYTFNFQKGLPTDWKRPDLKFSAGTFAFRNDSYNPPLLANVIAYKGNFNEILPTFKKEVLNNTPIALLYVDTMSYEPTKQAFTAFEDNIVPGTIIIFDEFYNYPNAENHEWKVLQEFLQTKKLTAKFLAFNIQHEQVALKIVATKKI